MSAQTDLSASAKQSLAYSYAALLLADNSTEITVESLDKLVKTSGNTTSALLSKVFARALEGKNVEDFFACGGGAAPAAAGGSAPAAETKAEEPQAEEEPEEDMDMGGLFD